MKISRKVSELLSRQDFHSDISEGAIFRKNVDGVTVLVLSILSDDALYLCQVS